MWWEDTLYTQVGETDIHVIDIKGLFWSEIDYIEDYFRVVEQHKARLGKKDA